MRQALVPLLNLREPPDAARTAYDPEALEALARSMKDLGQLQEIVVREVGDGTYEIRAGMRRYRAARMAGIPELRAVVLDGDELASAALIAENLDREELAPTDEALYYHRLYLALGEDTERVAAQVRRRREHVEARLNLLAGYASVLAALRAGEIGLAVAEAFNGMSRERDAEVHVEHARRGGCTAAQARQWRDAANARARLEAAEGQPPPAPGASGPAAPIPPTPPDPYAARARPYEMSSSLEPRPCLRCAETFPEWKMYRKFLCPACASYLDDVAQGKVEPRG